MSHITRLAVATSLAILAPAAFAATVDTSFQVSITVQNSCTIAATPLVFPDVTGNIPANHDATATLTVTCNDGAAYAVGLSNGTNGNRLMNAGGAQNVAYELYSDAGHSSRWGALNTTEEVGGIGTNSAQAMTVFGRIASSQSVAAGTYTDTVTATIEF